MEGPECLDPPVKVENESGRDDHCLDFCDGFQRTPGAVEVVVDRGLTFYVRCGLPSAPDSGFKASRGPAVLESNSYSAGRRSTIRSLTLED